MGYACHQLMLDSTIGDYNVNHVPFPTPTRNTHHEQPTLIYLSANLQLLKLIVFALGTIILFDDIHNSKSLGCYSIINQVSTFQYPVPHICFNT